MAITFVNAGTPVGSSVSITPGLPSGIVEGDLLIILIETANQDVYSMPAGWTEFGNGASQGMGTAGAAGGTRLTIYYRFYTSGVTAPTIPDTGDHTVAVILAFRGVNLTTPFGNISVNTGTSSYTITFPTLNVSTANCMIVNALASDRDANSSTVFSNWANSSLNSITECADYIVSATNGGGIGAAYGIFPSTGTVAATTCTNTYINNTVNVTFALIPFGSFEPLNGSVPGVSNLSGNVQKVAAISGLLSQSSAVTASLGVSKAISGGSVQTTNATASLLRLLDITGAAIQDSMFEGQSQIYSALLGSIESASDTSGTVEVQAGVQIAIVGEGLQSSDCTGLLNAITYLTSEVVQETVVFGVLGVDTILSGAIEATSTILGDVEDNSRIAIVGSSQVILNTSGELKQNSALSVLSEALSTVDATGFINSALNAIIEGVSDATAELSGFQITYVEVSGNSNQVSRVTGTIYFTGEKIIPLVEVDCVSFTPEIAIVETPVEVTLVEYSLGMEVDWVANIGSTVTLKANFPVSAGDLSLLTEVKVEITDQFHNVVETITAVTETSTGIYETNYTIPDGYEQLYYAWSGVLESVILLRRKELPATWND